MGSTATAARVVIVGGGIGGLAAALGVVRAGHRATVLERSREFRELGAGIQMGPNAFKALERLGAGSLLRRHAVFVDDLRLMDALTGRPLARLALDDRFRERFGAPYAVVHRGQLHQALLQECRERGVELRSDAAVTGYRQDDTGVRALLHSGEEVAGDALVGADGLRSVVRGQLVGDGEPTVSGHVTYRAVIPAEQMPEELRLNSAVLWAGPKCHLVHYPLADGSTYNAVVTRDIGAREAVSGQPVAKEEVLRQFAGVAEAPRRLLEAGNDWKAWVLCDRPSGGPWQDGLVALLGDAAHPMLQYAAQGACMALEDAACLSEEIDGPAPDFEKVLARYVTARRDRTARVQQVSREMGRQVYHPSGEAAAERDALFAGLGQEHLHDKLAWLYGE